jgi:outer membrane protein assembly factor BamB/tetratricopeptide (TPR) repeat protein
MSWNTRRAFLVLLALLVAVSALWLEQGRAQVKIAIQQQPGALPAAVPPPGPDASVNPDGFLNGGISLPKDEKGRGKSIEAAIDYIKEEDWKTAIPTLQKLLEIDEDVFVRLTRKNAENKEVSIWVSVKQEADRLIGGLPAAGLDYYKVTYGARAADLLKKAKQSGDPALLAELMKKYAHTDAGGEAIKLLADYHLDRGNYIAAGLCYSKLLSRQGAEKVSNAVLCKAAWAAHMAPASTTSNPNSVLTGNMLSEKEIWKQLRARTREVQLGDQTYTVDELEEHVAKLERPNFSQNATDAVVFRATPSRSNQLVGGPAFMSATWRQSMMHDDEKENPASYERLKKAIGYWSKDRKQPIIPAFSPITVTVTRGDKKVPLLVYKNYWGLMARDLKSGETAWASPSSWSLERMLRAHAEPRKQQAMTSWLQYYVDQNQHPQILFENSTVGTLSTDGQFVYVVEDLAVPPPQTGNMHMGFNPNMNNTTGYSPEVQDAVAHSRLQAFELKTNGKLSWELGTPEEKGPLSDCYFLGPPLPLGGKLYVLTEKQQELRLVCLDPAARGKVISTQTLGTSQEKMQNDVMRRTNAAHLAYGEGILVCPTNAGAVFGINLLENSLVWAYPYREKSDTPPQQHFDRFGRPRGFIVGPDGRVVQPTQNHNQWKASAPVIADGKVIFTAPDSRSLHCINLRDGSRVWQKPKLEDDLYLGNVSNGKVLIVGKKSVRGLSLSSGEVLWTLDTGVPSGQGIASDNVYYLPLKEGGRFKKPQICAIDMEHGKIVGSSESRPRTVGEGLDVPGNLLFYEGDVVSLTPTEVVVYPQLKVKIAQMDELIAKNPNDPVGLTERGELRLDKNDLAGAIEDLSTALKNNPSKETRARARGKLYDTLTAYISDHFNEAEKYLKEYEDLCKVDMDEAPPEKRAELEAEQRRRRATYLWLVGKGREEQGRLVEAFEKYQQFGAEAGTQQELVPAVDERTVKAAPDVWSRGRIIAMMARAKPEHREPLEKLIADKWDKLRQTNDLPALRQFVRMFGSVSAAGKEARLQLVERLFEQKESADEHPLLEAELELNQFRTGQHSPELAARATEALARLYTRKGLLEDAAYCYRRLGGEFAKVPVRDGKTGRDFYDDTATDKRLLPYLDEPEPFSNTKLKAKKVSDDFSKQRPGHGQLFQFEHSGERLPYFRHHIVGLNFGTHEFKLLDRKSQDDAGAPREVWARKLTPTQFQLMSNQALAQVQNINNLNANGNNPPHAARFPYRTVGHLVVLPVGHLVYGIDPVNRRVLWEVNLAVGGSGGPIAVRPGVNPANGPTWNAQHPPLVDPRDGSVVITYADGWVQRLGQAGPLEGQTVCVQTREALTALDPLTGRVLWSRSDVNSRNRLFADEDHVFVVELNNENQAHAGRVFRAADGITVPAPDFATLFQKRLQVLGRNILISESGPGGHVVLRLVDALTSQDVWKESYPARSLVVNSEEPYLTGVVEPDGKVHVVDLRTRKEVMSGKMDNPSETLRNVQVVHLLADRRKFYFACQGPVEANNANRLNVNLASNVMTQLGMRTVSVNGRICAFGRDDGSLEWYVPVKNQYLVLDQFADLPVVLLTARHQELRNMGVGQQWSFVSSAMSIEKRSGRVLVDESDLKLPQTTNFYGVSIDRRAGTIDLLSDKLKITHFPDPASGGKRADSATSPAVQGAQAASPAARPSRYAVDRAPIREIANPLPPR